MIPPLESELLAEIRLALGRVDHSRLFRNQVGEGWVGILVARDATTITLERPRRVTMGLCPGSGDLIGWTSQIITPAMVGSLVAVFTSAEIKRRGGRVETGQGTWRTNVHRAGGFAGVVRSADEALHLVRAK